MIITIDKTKELTRKEYVDFLQKTKGESISEARISQLVTANKLKVRDYPELNNLQLIVLDDDEQALAQARFSTTQPIHTYSYKDLGLMFGKLIHDLTNEAGNAKTLLTEKQEQVNQLAAALQQTESERNQAHQEAKGLTETINQLTTDKKQQQSELNELIGQLEQSRADITQLTERIAMLQQKLDTETAFRSEFEDFKQLVMSLLQKKKPSKEKSNT